MASRSRSRDRYRSRSRSLTPRSNYSRSPDQRDQRRRPDSRSTSPIPRRNGRHRSESRSWSRDRESRDKSDSPTVRSTKVVVERLTKNINEEHLQEIFGQFGSVKDLDLPINRTSGTNRGTAYILYAHEADAEAAIAHMHEAQIDGSVINVSIVLPRRKFSPAPPTARRGAGFDPRLPHPGPRGARPPAASFGAGPLGGGGGQNGPRRSPPPTSRYGPRSDTYRPRSLSRSPSRSPIAAPPSRGAGARYRTRSRSYSSRSRSRSPPRRGGPGRRGSNDYGRRRRSPSRSSYGSHGNRSRSPSRGRGDRVYR